MIDLSILSFFLSVHFLFLLSFFLSFFLNNSLNTFRSVVMPVSLPVKAKKPVKGVDPRPPVPLGHCVSAITKTTGVQCCETSHLAASLASGDYQSPGREQQHT